MQKRNSSVSKLMYASATASAALMLAAHASAATLTYDADTTPPANDGTGVWDTTTANWYNGATDVLWPNTTGDTAIFGVGGTIANAAAGTVTVGTVNAGTIQFNPTLTTGYLLTGGTITLGTGITTTSSLTSTISSVIAGTNGLAFNGVLNATNGLTLSGANTYTGITTTSTGGRLSTGNATALGSSVGATAIALGANYTLINANTTVNVGNSTSEAFLVNGQGSVPSGNPQGSLRIANGVALASLVQLGSASLITSNFGVVALNGNLDLATFTASFGNGNNAGTFNLNGVVTGTAGGITVNNTAGNIVNLTNAGNTYAGATIVNSNGALGLGGDTVLGGSTLALNGGIVQSTNATARSVANAITVGGNPVFGAATIQIGALSFTNAATVGLGGNRTFTTNVNTTFANGFSGANTLTKLGTATLFMNGANTYTGLTTVSAGTLGGTGTFAGAVTVASGTTLAPGNSNIGTLSAASAAVAGTFAVEYDGTGTGSIDKLNVTGTLDLTGSTLTLTNLNAPADDAAYILASYGTLTGTFGSPTLPAGYTLNYAYNGNNIALVNSSLVPEPTTLAAIGAGAVSLLRRRRRA